MSGNALKKLGIDSAENNPTKGILVRLSPAQYLEIKRALMPFLESLGDPGFWRSGGAGSFDPEHRYAAKGTNKIDSGDVDVFMDTDRIKHKLKLDPKSDDAAVRKTVLHHVSQHYPALQTGKNVHLGFPTGHKINNLPTYFQVDLMIMQHAHEIGQHHEHDYSVKNSPYGGQDQQFAMASIINTIPGHPPRTFQYNGFGGALQNRATGEVITRDINKVAELALGPGHTANDLGNVESIIAAVGGINSPRLEQFRADMAKKYPHLKEGSTDWFKLISQKLAI